MPQASIRRLWLQSHLKIKHCNVVLIPDHSETGPNVVVGIMKAVVTLTDFLLYNVNIKAFCFPNQNLITAI